MARSGAERVNPLEMFGKAPEPWKGPQTPVAPEAGISEVPEPIVNIPEGPLDRWESAGLYPPDFIAKLYESNLPDSSSNHDIVTNPINRYQDLLDSFASAIEEVQEEGGKSLSTKFKERDALEAVEGFRGLVRKNKMQLIETPDGQKLPPIKLFDRAERLRRLEEGFNFVQDKERTRVRHLTALELLMRSGNLILHQCMGPEWMNQYKEKIRN